MTLSAFLLGLAGISSGIRSVDGGQVMPGGQQRTMIETQLESAHRQSMPMLTRTNMYKLDKPKTSPLHGWEFEWISTGYGATNSRERMLLRTRVFSQMRKSRNDPTHSIARMVMRMWDMNYSLLGKDHPENHYLQLVDIYLCFGGEAGGQQLVSQDPECPTQTGAPSNVNTIYFYDSNSFREPIEMAREVAHEYGHATLNAFGIYTAPEDFAGGDIGERLYLTWLLKELKANRISTDDVMGASIADLENYAQQKVHPLVREFARTGPKTANLDKRDKSGFDALLGAVLYADAILPPQQLRRAMDFIDNNREGAADEIYNAASELPELSIQVPGYLGGEAIWLPAGKGRVTGGKVLQTVGNWVKVQPQADTLSIAFPKSP